MTSTEYADKIAQGLCSKSSAKAYLSIIINALEDVFFRRFRPFEETELRDEIAFYKEALNHLESKKKN